MSVSTLYFFCQSALFGCRPKSHHCFTGEHVVTDTASVAAPSNGGATDDRACQGGVLELIFPLAVLTTHPVTPDSYC